MGSKGRLQPHLRQSFPVPDMMHPDLFAPGIRPPPGPFFDMLPPPEIMEQKLALQHSEMQKLATENQRLAESHVVLRQELAAAQHELQRLQTQIGAVQADKEQQMKSLHDKITKMETDMRASESVKVDLQQAHAEAQNLAAIREELISKVQHLSQDLRQNHANTQKIPAMMSELENLRREYHDCRVTYEYERKLFLDHLESLQVMEKNYISMSKEVEKLRSELANSAIPDKRGGVQYGANSAYQGNDAFVQSASAQGAPMQHTGSQSTYGDNYNASQGRTPPSGGGAPYGVNAGGAAPNRMAYDGPRTTGYEMSRTANYDTSVGGGGYDASRGSAAGGYDTSHGAGGSDYDSSRVAAAGFDNSRVAAAGYDTFRGTAYDASRTSAYDATRGTMQWGYEATRSAGYDAQRGGGVGYDASRGQPAGAGGQATAVPGNPAGEQPLGAHIVRR